jgi:hypothetical protein
MQASRRTNPLGGRLRAFVARSLAAWVGRQRERYRADPRAVVLSAPVRRKLAPFFDDDLLRRVSFVTLEADSADRPPFFAQLRAAGLSESVLSHFTDVSAITYQDVVVMPRRSPDLANLSLVFHELVHVVQFDQLGPRGFLERYLDGWLAAGCRYEGIPLELDANLLQRRFEADPAKPFDVAKEVRTLLNPQ